MAVIVLLLSLTLKQRYIFWSTFTFVKKIILYTSCERIKYMYIIGHYQSLWYLFREVSIAKKHENSQDIFSIFQTLENLVEIEICGFMEKIFKQIFLIIEQTKMFLSSKHILVLRERTGKISDQTTRKLILSIKIFYWALLWPQNESPKPVFYDWTKI